MVKERLLQVLTGTPQDRGTLCWKLGISDRKLRQAVKELRDEGHPVCTNSGIGGYWLGNDQDVKRLIREYESRAFKELETARALKRRALDNQVRWNETLDQKSAKSVDDMKRDFTKHG